ncbi:MAG: ankyrin repeat domain-containing protein, partial [Planctomycetota bacterium]
MLLCCRIVVGMFVIAVGCCGTGFCAQPQDLWKAAKQGDVAAVRAVLADGVAVDAPTPYGATALAFAAERGHLDVVELLIDQGADVNNQDQFYGFTPRTWAQFGGHQQVVKLLEEHGGKVSLGRKRAEAKNADRDAADKDAEADETPATAEAGESETEQESTDEVEPTTAPQWDVAQLVADDAEVSSPNWPQFRGTGARGLADGQHPPLVWSGAEGAAQNLRWKTRIPGLGNSSPVVW